MPTLFDPLRLGALELPNRIIMAPLTRCRATPDTRIPTLMMVDYYRQRASAGLILSEATSVDPMGVGYPATPGIWSDEQAEGWTAVTRAVHEAGGRIFLQLWHVGRISDPVYLNGELPVAPSAVRPAGHVSLLRPQKDYEIPRALGSDEIPHIVASYRRGAVNAKAAGFDGVEVHGANGYLLDQFLQDRTNLRSDRYGGSLQNRARLMLEVVDAILEVWEPGRVGMHLAPRADSHDMGDSDLLATFRYIGRELGKRQIGFICARESRQADSIGPAIKDEFRGPYIVNEGFDSEAAQKALDDGIADAVAFGKMFISNPDLPERFATKAALNAWDLTTFYGGGRQGYLDYPTLNSGLS